MTGGRRVGWIEYFNPTRVRLKQGQGSPNGTECDNFNPTRVRLKRLQMNENILLDGHFNPTRVRLKPCPIVGTQPLI